MTFDGSELRITGDVVVDGKIRANEKSFDIVHPTKEGYRLRYGSLEGPENGVYVRGRTRSNIIELPDYWVNLIDEKSITVNLTPIGSYAQYFVQDIKDNKIFISSMDENIDTFYVVFAERKDVSKIIVEYVK
jgi:hypothetical protein